MRQLTLATASFDKHSKLTRRAAFLAEMEQVVPWHELCAVVEPFYPKPGTDARRSGWSGCCGCTSCSIGATCLIRPPRSAV
jgi:hypothetical protein